MPKVDMRKAIKYPSTAQSTTELLNELQRWKHNRAFRELDTEPLEKAMALLKFYAEEYGELSLRRATFGDLQAWLAYDKRVSESETLLPSEPPPGNYIVNGVYTCPYCNHPESEHELYSGVDKPYMLDVYFACTIDGCECVV